MTSFHRPAGAAPPRGRPTVVIVGGGFSGATCAAQLLQCGLDMQVVLIERQGVFARGLAYGQPDDNLLLNAPAGNMSAFAQLPDHFLEYCRDIDPTLGSGSFVPRRLFGEYLSQVLGDAERQAPGRLLRIDGEALALQRPAQGCGGVVMLDDGRRFHADAVLLTLGHAAPRDPLPAPGLPAAPQVVTDPWHLPALDTLPVGSPVLIIGSGHTAIDAVFRLVSRAPSRRILLVSRHGLLPHAHRTSPKPPKPHGVPPGLDMGAPSIRGCLRALRTEVEQRTLAGDDWRDVMNELRPHLPVLWRRLPNAERRRFLRHAVAYWDIHRHRLAPVASRRLQGLLDAGTVEVVAGRLLACVQDGSRLRVSLRPRGAVAMQELVVGSVVNCGGPRSTVENLQSPLVRQLSADGLLRRDALGLGLHVDASYRLLDRNGHPVDGVHYLGPGLKADHWEGIAVPELRQHVQALASVVQQELASRILQASTV